MATRRTENLKGTTQNTRHKKKVKSDVKVSPTKFKNAPVKKRKKGKISKKTESDTYSVQQTTSIVFQQEGKLLLTASVTTPVVQKTRVLNYFPKIFRSFTETYMLLGLLSVVFILGIIILTITIHKKIEQRNILTQKRGVIQQQITRWMDITKKYPGYRDAYFQLAVLEYRLGDFQASQDYLNTVESLDPNYERAYQLEKILQR